MGGGGGLSRDYSLFTLRVVYVTPAGLMKGRVGDLLATFLLEEKKTPAIEVFFAVQTKSRVLIIHNLILKSWSTMSTHHILQGPNFCLCIPEVVTMSTLS
jgi:hypothetical protein